MKNEILLLSFVDAKNPTALLDRSSADIKTKKIIEASAMT
jgi:hypothetical protein